MGMGSVLACWWLLQLDHCSLAPGVSAYEGSPRRPSATNLAHVVVDLCLRGNVGLRRAYFWAHYALSRDVTRHGSGAWLLRSIRHAGSTYCQEPVSRHSW